jgi:flagellar hook-length control protein FliK
MDMRSPLPLPAAPARQALAAKSARKATSGTSANRAARKATSSHDSATTHRSSRRKGATNDATKSTTDKQQDAALDFAAMLAQNAAQPATATQTPSTAKDAKSGDPVGADTASALLRPQGLTAITAPGAEGDTATVAAADAADEDAANAATAAAEKPAVEIETAGAAAAESAAATGADGAAVSVPSELVAAPSDVTAATTDGVPGLHRRDVRDASKTDDLSSTTAPAPEISDVATTAASGGADAASTSSDQSTGDQPGTAQQQPDLTGATAAAGVQHSATGAADAVSEAPMPAHTVAPTIAQVARSLRTSGDGTSRLVIRLDPVELGPVLVSLRTRGGAVDISVRADNAGGAAAVADQRAHIQQVLAEHGLDLSSFSVSGGEASGGAGSSTTDQGTSDSSGDGQNGNTGPDANAASYADVQAQANGADGQAGDRRAFAAPQDSVGAFRTTAPTSSTDGAAEAAVRTVRREGTWL